jgi:RNA polymerase subunit RPABC4/transcription elongation factor Spt4
MEASLARALQVLLALSGAYLAALWVVLVVWTYRDIEARSRSVLTQAFSTMLAAFFFVPGVLLYMMLRPKETLDLTFQRTLEEEYLLQDIESNAVCHNCHKAIGEDYVLCPHCHTELQAPCLTCGRAFDVRWSLCPFCGHAKDERPTVIRPVIQPIERYVRSQPQPTIAELPMMRAIEELEAQAFYRLEAAPPPPQVAATSGRAFDRRKTREMNRIRNLRGPMTVPESNGSPVGTEAPVDGSNGSQEPHTNGADPGTLD